MSGHHQPPDPGGGGGGGRGGKASHPPGFEPSDASWKAVSSAENPLPNPVGVVGQRPGSAAASWNAPATVMSSSMASSPWTSSSSSSPLLQQQQLQQQLPQQRVISPSLARSSSQEVGVSSGVNRGLPYSLGMNNAFTAQSLGIIGDQSQSARSQFHSSAATLHHPNNVAAASDQSSAADTLILSAAAASWGHPQQHPHQGFQANQIPTSNSSLFTYGSFDSQHHQQQHQQQQQHPHLDQINLGMEATADPAMHHRFQQQHPDRPLSADYVVQQQHHQQQHRQQQLAPQQQFTAMAAAASNFGRMYDPFTSSESLLWKASSQSPKPPSLLASASATNAAASINAFADSGAVAASDSLEDINTGGGLSRRYSSPEAAYAAAAAAAATGAPIFQRSPYPDVMSPEVACYAAAASAAYRKSSVDRAVAEVAEVAEKCSAKKLANVGNTKDGNAKKKGGKNDGKVDSKASASNSNAVASFQGGSEDKAAATAASTSETAKNLGKLRSYSDVTANKAAMDAVAAAAAAAAEAASTSALKTNTSPPPDGAAKIVKAHTPPLPQIVSNGARRVATPPSAASGNTLASKTSIPALMSLNSLPVVAANPEPVPTPANPPPPRHTTWAGSLFPSDEKSSKQTPSPAQPQAELPRPVEKSSSPAPRVATAEIPLQQRQSASATSKMTDQKSETSKKNGAKNTSKGKSNNGGSKTNKNNANYNSNPSRSKSSSTSEDIVLNNGKVIEPGTTNNLISSSGSSSSSSSSPFKMFVDNLHPVKNLGFSQLRNLLTKGGESGVDEVDDDDGDDDKTEGERDDKTVGGPAGEEECVVSATPTENRNGETVACSAGSMAAEEAPSSSSSGRLVRRNSLKEVEDSGDRSSLLFTSKKKLNKQLSNGKIAAQSSSHSEGSSSGPANNYNNKRASSPTHHSSSGSNNANSARHHNNNHHNNNNNNKSEAVNVLRHMKRDIGNFLFYFLASSKHNLKKINDVYLSKVYAGCRWFFHQLLILFLVIVVASFKIASFALRWICAFAKSSGKSVWDSARRFYLTKLAEKRPFIWLKFLQPKENKQKRSKIGMEENIPLPTTGDEALKRLLAGRGKDPYSILGLRCDASDDDVKKYYRRQAMLVHPDKNQEVGADEAFKILGHAFDVLGDPEKREKYDAQAIHDADMKDALDELGTLLTRLQKKMADTLNTMRCEPCGGKHPRLPTERAWYAARYCSRCRVMHSAKEGDVWAESTMFGLIWRYYALMNGTVFEITDWAKCQVKRDNFKHMAANSHQVIYRLAGDGTGRGGGSGVGGGGVAAGGGRSRSEWMPENGPRSAAGGRPPSEADLENLISNLFASKSTSGAGGAAEAAGAAAASGAPNTAGGAAAAAASNAKVGKKGSKKKRH